jgi:hypothetical protein
MDNLSAVLFDLLGRYSYMLVNARPTFYPFVGIKVLRVVRRDDSLHFHMDTVPAEFNDNFEIRLAQLELADDDGIRVLGESTHLFTLKPDASSGQLRAEVRRIRAELIQQASRPSSS